MIVLIKGIIEIVNDHSPRPPVKEPINSRKRSQQVVCIARVTISGECWGQNDRHSGSRACVLKARPKDLSVALPGISGDQKNIIPFEASRRTCMGRDDRYHVRLLPGIRHVKGEEKFEVLRFGNNVCSIDLPDFIVIRGYIKSFKGDEKS